MSSTSVYFLSRDLKKKIFQPYFHRSDNTYTGFARSAGYSIRLFNCPVINQVIDYSLFQMNSLVFRIHFHFEFSFFTVKNFFFKRLKNGTLHYEFWISFCN